MTHDYKRNGVTTLFAALNVLTGQVLSMTVAAGANMDEFGRSQNADGFSGAREAISGNWYVS